jgi:hypothetical protein
MKTIWKFTLQPDSLTLRMPLEAKILHVDEQHGKICLWAEVDDDLPEEERIFEIFGTGHKMIEQMGISREYIGTAKMQGGSFIFHVYEYTGI